MNGIVRSLLFLTAIGLLAVVLVGVSDDSEAEQVEVVFEDGIVVLYQDRSSGSPPYHQYMIHDSPSLIDDSYYIMATPIEEEYGNIYLNGVDVGIGDRGFRVSDYPEGIHFEVFKSNYSVEFGRNGGEGEIQPSITNMKNTDNYRIPDVSYTRLGYSSVEWNTREDGLGESISPGSYIMDLDFIRNHYSLTDNNLILYPKWTPVGYSITLSSEFGTLSDADWSLAEGKFSRGYNIESEKISLPTPEPDDRFHLFVNWEDSDGYPVSQIATGTTGDIELKAAWTEKSYPIIAKINGKEVTFDLTLSSEMPYAEPEEGFAFKGWYYRDDDGNEIKFQSMSQMTENMEIYAVFEPTQDDPVEIAVGVIGILLFFIVVVGYGFTRE